MSFDISVGSLLTLLTVVAFMAAAFVVVLSKQRAAYTEALEKRLALVIGERDDERQRCARDVAELRGQLQVLQSDLLDRMLSTFLRAMKDMGMSVRAPHRRGDPDTEDWR